MKPDDFQKLSFICGMNQRYCQKLIDHWDSIDKWTSRGVASLALIAMVLALWAYLRPGTIWRDKWYLAADFLSFFFALLTLAVAMALNIAPTTSMLNYYSANFQRWSDLRREVDSYWVDVLSNSGKDAAFATYFDARYRDLQARKNSLNALEPMAPDDERLEQCYREEKASRSQEPPAEPPKL
jgi:hypothetical protein